MSTATEISRLTDARNTIRDKLIDLGLATSTSKLDALADAIDGIANRGAISATVQEGDTYTIPAGYHNGSGTVSGVAGGGNYSLQSKTVTPTKSQQSITPDSGYYGLSDVTVAAIPEAYQNVSSVNATAADVLAGKVIVNSSGTSVTGTMTNNGAVTRTLSAATGNQTYTIPAGYHNGSGTVNVVLETKSVTPTTSSQTVSPTSGKVLSSVTVAAIPSNFADTTDDDAVAANILSGKKAHSYNSTTGEAVAVTGTMANNGGVSVMLDTTGEGDSYTIPQGYHDGTGKVNVSTENRTVTPTKSTQQITSTNFFRKVTVNPIPDAYQDVTNVDATAADVLSGKIIVAADGTEVTGSMTNNTSVTTTLDATSNNQEYTIPQGYHAGTGKVKIVLESKSATPTTSSQTIIPTAGKVLSSVTVSGIPSQYKDTTNADAVAADVLTGKVFVNGTGEVTGTMADNGTVTHTLDATTANQSFTIAAGKHSGSGAVNIVLETKSATPTTSSQTITPTAGKVLSSVTVAAIPVKYGDTTGDTAVAANLLAGAKAHTIVNGTATQITGTMANNGAISETIDGLTTTSYTVPAGYTSGGTVSLDNTIELALAAI